ncbi:hypothetical protein G6F60_014841 [Rhizopus arrhizus]|nr:hypothetical protein G6F60_014841 [Rhizopus arrhizus]
MTAARRGWDAPLSAWFQAQGWKPAPFQRETWRRYLDGQSGLLHTPTGSGKTLAARGAPGAVGHTAARAGGRYHAGVVPGGASAGGGLDGCATHRRRQCARQAPGAPGQGGRAGDHA